MGYYFGHYPPKQERFIMPPSPERRDITGHPLIPLEKNSEGVYIYPRERYGILPYYIDHHGLIIWGLIESDRFEAITHTPAAGTQDIIVIKEDQRLVLELGKPLPELGDRFSFLHPFIGKSFRDSAYQEILASLSANGFHIYAEDPLATALHEASEEQGIDLDKTMGRDVALLKIPLAFSQYQIISSPSAAAILGVWLPELTSIDTITLLYTNKIDRKVPDNLGREFYEKGVWITLAELKTRFRQEIEKFNSVTIEGYSHGRASLAACECYIPFLEQMEHLIKGEPAARSISTPPDPILSPKETSISDCRDTFFNSTTEAKIEHVALCTVTDFSNLI